VNPPRTVDLVAYVQHGRLYFGARSVEAVHALTALFPDAPWVRDADDSGPYCATGVRVDPSPLVWVEPLGDDPDVEADLAAAEVELAKLGGGPS